MIEGFNWNCTSNLYIEESEKDSKGKIITGTLVVKGFAQDGKHYFTTDEIENISKSVLGKTVKFGSGMVRDPDGNFNFNGHFKQAEDDIGVIEKIKLSEDKTNIQYWARIHNTEKNPYIEETVKIGWGISIAGWAKTFERLKNGAMRIIGMVVDSVSLLPPHVGRGQRAAKVEGVYIAESQMQLLIPKKYLIFEGLELNETVKF